MLEKYALNDMFGAFLIVIAIGVMLVTAVWFILRINAAFEAAAKYRRKYQEAADELERVKLKLGDQQIENDHLKRFRQHARIEYDTEVDALYKSIENLQKQLKHKDMMIETLSKQIMRNKKNGK